MLMIVDFNRVPADQLEIHDRLINWAKWARGSRGSNVHPMFRQYRNDYWEPAAPQSYSDTLDAVKVQKVMKDVPEKHRIAVQWCYIARSNPTKACKDLGVSKAGLMELIDDGRAMIRNRLKVKEAA